MAGPSSIEWTQATWNPVTGCSRASAGCDHCYAVRMTHRLAHMGGDKYSGLTHLNAEGKRHFNGVVKCHEDALATPLGWASPTTIFVNSMADLFHRRVPEPFIQRVFEVMLACPHHTFQVLTKRPERAAALADGLDWPENVWLGTSVENAAVTERIDWLRRTPAATRFLSVEPLIGPLPRLSVAGLGWVITGGESGPGARPVEADWLRRIRDRCVRAGVPHFFKQWGRLANNPDAHDPTAKENGGSAKGGRTLDGLTWSELPERPWMTATRKPARSGRFRIGVLGAA